MKTFKYVLLSAVVLLSALFFNQTFEIERKLPNNIVISSGRITDLSYMNKFGRNIEIDMAQPADIWSGGANTVGNQIYKYEGFITSPSVIKLVSTSGLDSIDSAGARTLQIFGLDSLWLEQDEIITLTGADTVTAINKYLRMFRMVVKTAGSSGWNEGRILAYADGDIRMAQIDSTNNQTLMAIYTVPANKIGFLMSHFASINNKKQPVNVPISIFIRPFGEVFQMKSLLGILSVGTSFYNYECLIPMLIQSKTDIKMVSGISSANGVDVSAGFTLTLMSR